MSTSAISSIGVEWWRKLYGLCFLYANIPFIFTFQISQTESLSRDFAYKVKTRLKSLTNQNDSTEKSNFNSSNFTSTEYSNFLTMMSCNQNEKSQVFTLRPSALSQTNTSLRNFDILLPDGKCLEPREGGQKNDKKRSIYGSTSCSSSWTWNYLGELV